MIYFMSRFKIGEKPLTETLARILVDDSVDYNQAFNEVFYEHLQHADLLSVDSDGSGKLELVYTVSLRRWHEEPALLSDLHKVHNSVQARFIHGHQNVNP